MEKRVGEYGLISSATHELKDLILNPSVNFLEVFGALLDKTWATKKKLEDSISSSEIDAIHSQLKAMGGYGGKLSGAGGGGFLFEIINEKYQQEVLAVLGQQRAIKIAYEPFGSRLLSEVY